MLRYLFGAIIGFGIALAIYPHQALKVDTYSFRVAYILGRVDQAQDDGIDNSAQACWVYTQHQLGHNVPFGYTVGNADRELTQLCAAKPSPTVREY